MLISKTERIGRLAITLPVIAVGLWGLAAGVPFAAVSPEQQWGIGCYRAAYGALVALRLARTMPGAAMLQGWRKTESVRRVYWCWFAVALCLSAGFLTPLAVLAHWAFGALVQRKARVYSVEDVLFRANGFCLIFLQPHLAFSIDSLLGWNFGMGAPFPLGVNFFAWTIALLMFSAALEKFWSPLWQKGLGFYYFMSLPHLVRPCFSWLNRSKALSWVLSWTTVAAELLLIPAMFLPWMRWPIYLVLAGFAVTLFVLTDLSFIGQITLLSMLLLAGLDGLALRSAAIAPLPGAWGVWEFSAFIFFGGLYALAAISCSGLVLLRSGLISKIMNWTTHFRPFSVFVEIHFYGLYLFRLIAKLKSGKSVPVLNVFTDEGHPGTLQVWRPRTFQGAMYRVTDYCIALVEGLPDRAIDRSATLEDLAYAGYEELKQTEAGEVEKIEIQVRVFDPADQFERDTSGWLSAQWQPVAEVTGFPKQLSVRSTASPPRYKKTYRWPVQFA